MQSVIPQPSEKKPGKAYYKSLDGLKYILIVFIVACHYYHSFVFSLDKLPVFFGSAVLFSHSHRAVEVFFIISGFLAAFTIPRKSDSLLEYTTGKLKHYLPLSIIATLVCILFRIIDLCWYNIFSMDISIWHVILCLTGTTRWFSSAGSINGPLWYVQVLVFCDIIYHILYHKKSKSYLLICIGIIVVSLGIHTLGYDGPFFNENMMRGVFNFFVGVLIYEFSITECSKKLISYIMFVAGIIILFFCCYMNSTQFTGNIGYIVTFIIGPGAVLGALYITPIRKLLSLKPLAYLGKTTYSILATHGHVLMVLRYIRKLGYPIKTNSRLFFLLYIVIATVVGIITYEVVERRFIPYILKKIDKALHKESKKTEAIEK